MSDTPRVFVAGDLNIDLIASISGAIEVDTDTPSSNSFHLGGSPTNTALWLKHSGIEPWLASCVGDDAWGDWARSRLVRAGLDTSAITTQEQCATGTCLIVASSSGTRTMFPDHGANNFLSLNSNLEAKIALSSAIVMSAYSFFNENTREFAFDVMACAKGFGVFVIVDAGSVAPIARTGVGLVRSFLNLADLVVANAQEFDLLTADSHGKTWFESVGNLVRKDGAAPAAWYSFGKEVTRVAPTPASVVDSTGAGDAFMAGLVRFLVTSQLAGEDLARGALTNGHAVAALAVAQVGASPKVDAQS